MIKPLRTYHYYLWRILAIILPVGFALAIVFRPDTHQRIESSGVNITSNITSDSTSAVTIEVLRSPQSPSCVVYAEGEKGRELLGVLNGEGQYSFNAMSFNKIILTDEIGKRILLEWYPEQ